MFLAFVARLVRSRGAAGAQTKVIQLCLAIVNSRANKTNGGLNQYSKYHSRLILHFTQGVNSKQCALTHDSVPVNPTLGTIWHP